MVSHGDALGPSPSISVPEPGEERALKSEPKKKDQGDGSGLESVSGRAPERTRILRAR